MQTDSMMLRIFVEKRFGIETCWRDIAQDISWVLQKLPQAGWRGYSTWEPTTAPNNSDELRARVCESHDHCQVYVMEMSRISLLKSQTYSEGFVCISIFIFSARFGTHNTA